MTLTELNTEQLIQRCRKQDQKAQMEIYKRYYKAMFNASFRILRNQAEAEDVMQESFLTAFTKLSSLDDDQLFGAWLKKIVINASLTFSKKKAKKAEVPLEVVDYVLTDENAGISQEDYTHVKVNSVLNCLDQIKESYGTILSLHLIEGYDYEEICEIMNISYANCRTLISRAKDSLRKKLAVVN